MNPMCGMPLFRARIVTTASKQRGVYAGIAGKTETLYGNRRASQITGRYGQRSAPVLTRNASHSWGCIARRPASHSCHARSPEYTRAPAWVWVRPAPSRADRMSAGVGLIIRGVSHRYAVFGRLLVELFHGTVCTAAASNPAKMVFDFPRLSIADPINRATIPLGFFPRNNEDDWLGAVEIINPGRLIGDFHVGLLVDWSATRWPCRNYTRTANIRKVNIVVFSY